jgi:hypothetical protein
LHHFIAAGVWDAVPVEAELLVQADTHENCETQLPHASQAAMKGVQTIRADRELSNTPHPNGSPASCPQNTFIASGTNLGVDA